MTGLPSFLFLFLSLALLPLAPGCAPTRQDAAPEETPQQEPAPEETISGTGTIKYIDLEGGFYGIAGDDGTNYNPINLAEPYRRDGLRVRFEATPRTDLLSTQMWGTLVELTRIDRL